MAPSQPFLVPFAFAISTSFRRPPTLCFTFSSSAEATPPRHGYQYIQLGSPRYNQVIPFVVNQSRSHIDTTPVTRSCPPEVQVPLSDLLGGASSHRLVCCLSLPRRIKIASSVLPGICDATFHIYDSPNLCPSASHAPKLPLWLQYEDTIAPPLSRFV